MDNVNLQLYSFGHDCPLTLLEKIQKTGEMGYAGVEFARGYQDIPVEDVKKALGEAGITADSAHVAFGFMEEDLPYRSSDLLAKLVQLFRCLLGLRWA